MKKSAMQKNVHSGIFVAYAANGSVSLPEWAIGRPEKEVAALYGSPLGVGPRTFECPRLGCPVSEIPLNDQPARFRLHAWIAKRGEGITVDTLSSALAKGKVRLVPFSFRGNPETAVVTSAFKDGQRWPKVIGVLPSATYKRGRLESYATRSDDRAVADNSAVRLSAGRVRKEKPVKEKPEAVKPKPVKEKPVKEKPVKPAVAKAK